MSKMTIVPIATSVLVQGSNDARATSEGETSVGQGCVPGAGVVPGAGAGDAADGPMIFTVYEPVVAFVQPGQPLLKAYESPTFSGPDTGA